jgi:hypothetical protein
MWLGGGKDAVTTHVEQASRTALADPATVDLHRSSAMMILSSIERRAKRRPPN